MRFFLELFDVLSVRIIVPLIIHYFIEQNQSWSNLIQVEEHVFFL